VLFRSEKTGKGAAEIHEIIKQGKRKLLEERNRRQTPFIDRTLYTSVNGMLISACLLGSRRLGSRALKDFALKSLEKIMKLRFTGNRLFHTDGVKALLDDYVCLIEALVSAFETTGDKSFLDKAERLMGTCIEKLWDHDEGGFFDSEDHVLEMKIKGTEDIPHPSANALGIMLLIRLHHLTEKKEYFMQAEKALKAFSPRAQSLGIHAAYYFCALDMYFNSLRLTLQALPSSELASEALSFHYPYICISYGEDKGRVIPCIKDKCYEPAENPAKLREVLKNISDSYMNS